MTVVIIMMTVSHDDGGVVMLLMRVVKVQGARRADNAAGQEASNSKDIAKIRTVG